MMLMRQNLVLKYLLLFFFGGFMYGAVEIVSRGYSHISMLIAGGICFIGIGLINEFLKEDTSLILQMALGAIVVTVIEFITGLIVNVWLKFDVWDYSNKPFNLYGQICLSLTLCWFFLSLPAILVDDYLRYRLFDQPKKKYKLF